MSDHLVLKGSTWHVRLDVPQDIRLHMKFFMKKVLSKSLKTGDKRLAKIASLEILSQWKSEFEAIRSGRDARVWINEAREAREKYIQAVGATQSDDDIIDLREERDSNKAILTIKYALNESERKEVADILKGEFQPRHQISESVIAKFEQHQIKFNVIEKTAAVQASTLRKYSSYLERNNLAMNHNSFAAFLDSHKASYKTLQNKIFAGNSYWKFLISQTPELRKMENPFSNHNIPKPQRGKSLTNSYAAFSPHDIESLYKRAFDSGDITLSNVIMIAAYTGCRIEEICQLTVNDVKNGIMDIKKSKSKAGIRQLPIPTSLIDLIAKLVKESTDGFIIPSSSGNKYGVRSDSISKRFGRLKSSMGYDSSFVFHSIRKTAATQMERAEVPPLTIMYILGHSRGSLTFDTYAKGPLMRQRSDALNSIKYDFL